KRAQLRRELEPAARRAVVERFDPEAVAGEDEPPGPRVPQRDREHPAQAAREGRPLLLVEVDEDLGVALRAEAMTGALELRAQLAIVVELAVLDDVDGAVLVRDRLVAGREVDDREAPRGEACRAVEEGAVAVGATVDELRAHPREAAGVGGSVRRD